VSITCPSLVKKVFPRCRCFAAKRHLLIAYKFATIENVNAARNCITCAPTKGVECRRTGRQGVKGHEGNAIIRRIVLTLIFEKTLPKGLLPFASCQFPFASVAFQMSWIELKCENLKHEILRGDSKVNNERQEATSQGATGFLFSFSSSAFHTVDKMSRLAYKYKYI